jgi:hypothetical protein
MRQKISPSSFVADAASQKITIFQRLRRPPSRRKPGVTKLTVIDGGRSADGGGPEDPMLELRVTRLEEDMREVKGILSRLEPMIIELVHTTAKKSDIERIEAKLAETREEVKEMKGEMRGLLPTRTFMFWMTGLFVALAGLFLRSAG